MPSHKFGSLLTTAFLGIALAVSAQTAAAQGGNVSTQKIKVIDVENHFENAVMVDIAKRTGFTNYDEMSPKMREEHEWEARLDDFRISEMDKAGIDYAQISLTTPSAESFDVEYARRIAADANNQLAKAIKRYPDRIGAYMTLVPEDVEWSLKEIDRCLAMGLWGWSTLSNYKGNKRLDDPKYFPILAKCNELKMPIFLHPMFPKDKQITEVGYTMYGPNYGFTVDTQLTFLRMLFRGIFDKYPNLKIILGHNAEGLAIYEDRVNTAHRQNMGQPYPEFGSIKHEPSYYLHHNLCGDTSGSFRRDVMHFTKHIFGDKFLVMGTDYPYEDAKVAVDLVLKDDALTFKEKKAILQDNAEALGFGFNRLKKH